MNSERMNDVEIIVARHIKNPYYREKFCRDGYAKILLLRLDCSAGPSERNSDTIRYANEYITYINKYEHDLERDMLIHINNPTEYYFTFSSAGIMLSEDIINLIHDCRADFEKCYDDAKSRPLSGPEEEIANSIKDEDDKENFIFDIEAKTLYKFISTFRYTSYNKERIDEAVDHYVAFIRDKYDIEVDMDRRRYSLLKINRNIDCHKSTDTSHILPVHPEPYHYNISSNAQLNELFDWVAQQVQNETNREALQAYSRVLDAIAVIVISDEDRSNRLSIDEKIAVMHFLEDEVNNILKHQK